MMEFRKEATTSKKEAELKKTIKDTVESPDTDHLDNEDDKEIMVLYLSTGMDSLKEEQRTCVEMFYLRDMSYQQIADETGYSMNEVKSYIQNGKRNLKNYITEKSNGKA